MNTPISDPVIRRANAASTTAPKLLFIHGLLDDETIWDGVIDAIGPAVSTARYDLPGFGARQDNMDPQSLTLKTLAEEAASILAQLGAPVFIVGHSLGTAIAQLLAADHPDLVAGLVLLTPIPLGGIHLPEQTIAPFRALATDAEAQRAVRAQLSPGLTNGQIDRLTRIGTLSCPEVGARYADLWNDGIYEAPATSAFKRPVLIIGGGADTFVTPDLIESVATGFTARRARAIESGGHWLHVEHPDTVACLILDFLDDVQAIGEN
jgi:pimeloyl-ACP methyl ester carboxylesterase